MVFPEMLLKVAIIRLAGGCAGAASRTVVSPLERLKIIQCVLVGLSPFFIFILSVTPRSEHLWLTIFLQAGSAADVGWAV